MVYIEITFSPRGVRSDFSIPSPCESFCEGCVLQGRCNAARRLEIVSLRERRVRWRTCLHSSNLSQYLLDVINDNSAACVIVGIKCLVDDEPKDERMYADINISSNLLLKMCSLRVQSFTVRARGFCDNGVVSEYSTTIYVESIPREVFSLHGFLGLDEKYYSKQLEKIAPDLWRIQIVDGTYGEHGLDFMQMICDNIDSNHLPEDDDVSRRICITNRGHSPMGLTLGAKQIGILCSSAQTTIEFIGVL